MKSLIRPLLFVQLLLGSFPVLAQSFHEILGRPTHQSITISAWSEQVMEVKFVYGIPPFPFTESSPVITCQAGTPFFTELQGLQPDTRYAYRAAYRSPGAANFSFGPVRSFHTRRPPGQSFSFVVQADPHMDSMSDSSLYRLCLDNQLADTPDFMIDLGDIFMSDKMKNTQGKITADTVTYRVALMRNYYESVCHSMPLFIALGNHEGESGWNFNGTADNVAVYGTLERKKYFPNPEPDAFYTGDETEYPFIGKRQSYYAWEWGDALFVVLDPYFFTKPKPDSLNGWRWTLGEKQYNWLKTTLENSPAAFKFVFAHQLVGGDPQGRGGVEFADKYEWGGKNLDGSEGWATNRPGWYKPIKDLLAENRVTIFFHGHDHFFAKQDRDCLVYQLCPQPSLPVFNGPNQAEDYGYFAGQILPNAGHLRVSVSPEGVKTEYVRAYLPAQETATRHNRDVSATYFIGAENCYDSLATGSPVLWNAQYSDELVYPNPSSGEVAITFSVTESERLYLDIFDLSGRFVRRLLAGDLIPAGAFQVFWDGRDGNGQALPDGTYGWQIRDTRGASLSGKIILMH